MKEYFSSEKVQFKVVLGDITSDTTIHPDNVLKKISELVDSVRSKYGYQ